MASDSDSGARRIEAVKGFNEFQAQARARVEAAVKLILLVSGSMLTLSVGAVLSDRPAHIPSELIFSLKVAWTALFYSIAASLTLMVMLVITSYHMGERWREALTSEESPEEGKIIRTWPALECMNWVVGISGALACLLGVALTAYVAVGVAGHA